MSDHSATAHDHHGHGHGHDDHDDGAAHSTFGGYMTGFVLAVILTVIPFWLVMGKVFESSSTTALILLGLGAIQIVVHMIYFLHMNAKSEGGWNMLALIFTIVLVVITLAGSLWVMYHMNVNMMPHMNMHDMQTS
ncbi:MULTISPECIES: cytochrome o ubiquinol oxidase subunit IV [unclassified Achromobacter]|uniref:cytochrome o ubiquinol oxidase subunit IV n=1 Tax=unclassified Achromobacter TaxID=2626865 RepID=UPI000B51E53D|nr:MULTISPECIES: cytochrome o ubiquinol oxidase subunit IV [unclassified Achromobacter]OWT72926.1 cytochrome o ubiquinol oxidase subunit IV [Achromobacter sp. HZ34]OWT74144.1 cytochrome o ubiquinol oxidase subunit IV [Achromobacter sp. HZ28]